MHHVKKQWLSLYAYSLLGLDLLFFCLYIWFNHISQNPTQFTSWGITPLILGVAFVHAFYIIAIFPFVRRKSEWIATFFSQAIFVFLLAALIETSLYNNLAIRLLYVVFVFSLGVTGPFVFTATVISTWVFFLYTYLGVLGNPAIQLRFELTMNILVTIAGIAGWQIFRRFYIKQKDKETLALSNLLQQEQFKSNVMLESISDGVIVIDAKGIVQVLNESAASMLGWAKGDGLGLSYESLLKPLETTQEKSAQSATEVIGHVLTEYSPKQGLVLINTKDNRQRYIDIVASPIKDPSEGNQSQDNRMPVGAVAVLRDVDEQKRQEQQRSEFISTASHEMRTPVAAIEGYLALALNPQVGTIDAKARSYIEKAHASTQHLGKLFQDLLTSAKAEDGRLVSHPQVTEMGQYLEQLVDTLRFTAEKKGLLLDFTVGTGSADDKNTVMNGKVVKPLYYTYVDGDRMREVITNIFDNAVKYTSTGKISIGLTGNSEVVQFFVKDTGPGIPAGDIEHLFQKFYRVDSSATRTIGGTGLGLFISRKIVELYNGRVWVESEFGKGSTFYINLPRLSTQKADELMKQESDNAQNSSPLDNS